MPRIDRRDPRPRPASAGAAYVYVLPLQWEDHAKIGHTRDPVGRMRTLHVRWYDFFDLERAWLVETDRVREALKLEQALAAPLAAHRAPAPLVVPESAGGATEWYRGVRDALALAATDLVAQGHRCHVPMLPWLRTELAARGDRLYEATRREWDAWQAGTANPELVQRRLRDMLDAWRAVGLDVAAWLPPPVWDWYRAQA